MNFATQPASGRTRSDGIISNRTKDLFIEPRFLLAYGLIALVVIGIAAAIYYARHQSHREVYRRQRKREKDGDNARGENARDKG